VGLLGRALAERDLLLPEPFRRAPRRPCLPGPTEVAEQVVGQADELVVVDVAGGGHDEVGRAGTTGRGSSRGSCRGPSG
jgi:hypothetical protein